MSTISFVYFDVGGVALLDFSGTNKWAELKSELGISLEKNKKFEAFWKKHEAEVCAGRDVETLIPLLKKEFGTQLPDSYSLLVDGFVKRFEKNPSIWPVINSIHKTCPVGLLTNMYTDMLDAIKEQGLLPEVKWDVIMDSSVVGLRKPDTKFFQLAEDKAGVYGHQILFVENSPGHVKAAQTFGWQTFLYDPVHSEESSQELSDKISPA